MTFRTLYNNTFEESEVFATINTEESLTQQSDRDDCDINIIMERYGATGQLPQVNMQAMQGDFMEVRDYRSALEAVNKAREEFANVPAKIRAEFGNDPAQFLAFVENPDNQDKLIEMGLAKKPPTPEPVIPPVPAGTTTTGN